jgi:type VI secretion system protein ImpC
MKLYHCEYGNLGGEPYGALLGDYEFTNHPEDLDLLSKISNVAAVAFCPFISAASPQLFGFESWRELTKPRDLEEIFTTIEYTKWRTFRDSEDARFVSLLLPRVLSRLPYGASTKPIEEFEFEEVDASRPVPQTHFSWMNVAYVMGTKLTDAFAKYGICIAIRGAESGGKVEGLPAFIFTSDDGDCDLMCPTEISINDRREAELSKLGFLSLCHSKHTDFEVFFSNQTTQKPQKYDQLEARVNAETSARLSYIMVMSRFVHYLKLMARDRFNSLMDASYCEACLDRWIKNYVNSNPDASAEAKARYPLAEARVQVREDPGKPGSYTAIAWIRPWLQFGGLTASPRVMFEIPVLGEKEVPRR